MRVVFDTNILCADFHLKGNDFRVFFEGMPRVGIQIYIPKVVIDEITNKYWQKLARIAKDSLGVCQKWQKATGTPILPPISFESANVEACKYKEYLLKTFDVAEATILPYPNTSHEVISQRAIEHRKPFKENGGGYRDTLIWESILSFFNNDSSPICFVTNNSKDFGGGPNVHRDLLQDLDRLKIKHEDVKIFNTLKDLNKELIIPNLEHLKEMIKKFENDEVSKFSLQTWVENDLWDILEKEGFGWSLVGLEELEGTNVVSEVIAIDDIYSIEINDIRRLPSGNLLIAAIAKVAVSVYVMAEIEDFYNNEDVRNFFGCNEPLSGDEMEEYTSVDQSITFSLIIEKESYKVISAKIDQLTYYSWSERQKDEQTKKEQQTAQFYNSRFSKNLMTLYIEEYNCNVEDILSALTGAKSINEFAQKMEVLSKREQVAKTLIKQFKHPNARMMYTEARLIFGLPPFKLEKKKA